MNMKLTKQKTLAAYFEELAAGEQIEVPIDPAGVAGWSEQTIYTTARRKACGCKKEKFYIIVTKR